jgi:hypothetical protein
MMTIMGWTPPPATVRSVERLGEGVRIVLQVEGKLSEPLYPASLHRSEKLVLHLDKCVERQRSGVLVFETYDEPEWK